MEGRHLRDDGQGEASQVEQVLLSRDHGSDLPSHLAGTPEADPNFAFVAANDVVNQTSYIILYSALVRVSGIFNFLVVVEAPRLQGC